MHEVLVLRYKLELLVYITIMILKIQKQSMKNLAVQIVPKGH